MSSAVTVVMETTMGNISLEINTDQAPITSENFLTYVDEGFFDGTIFHRVIPNFMIQGGGFTPDMGSKSTRPPIGNEAANGLVNDRGTIAMARTSDPDSATAQFFINVRDNANLNYASDAQPGYAVFGKVTEGMDVADAIVAVKTTSQQGHDDVPAEPILMTTARRAE